MRRLEQSWRTRGVARVDEVPRLRNEVVALVEQECPEADLEAVALIATELVVNVVRHAYPDGTPGLVEVDVDRASTGEAAVTVRDWGRGFHACPTLGTGLGIVANLSGTLRIESTTERTEVRAQIPTVAPPTPPSACVSGLADRELFRVSQGRTVFHRR
jgi:two-component sensor histidine kinase